MSKLAHSNDETMYEIELRMRGMTRIIPEPEPICEHVMQKTWWREGGQTCKRKARFTTQDGRKLCKCHAEIDEL